MSMLVKIGEHRLAALFGVVLLLLAMGSVSSKLLVTRGSSNVESREDGGPLLISKGLSADQEAGSPMGTGRNMKMATRQAPGEPKALGGLDFPAQTPVAELPPFQDRIIKTGSITLKIKKGKFSDTYEQVIMVARAGGGYVAGSNSVSVDDRLASGTLTIRIPSKNFELVLAKLRRFGKLTALDINSQDVSTEFVDLESRLRHWRSQETILLNLMNKAANIADSITIQQQLSQVQLEIEQITGRLNYLKNQTSFSSVQVTITEPGVMPRPLDRWGFKTAVVQAAHAFIDTINGLIVLTGYLSPLLLVIGLAGLVWLRVRGWLSLAGPVQ